VLSNELPGILVNSSKVSLALFCFARKDMLYASFAHVNTLSLVQQEWRGTKQL
jgi:hypothetical protein